MARVVLVEKEVLRVLQEFPDGVTQAELNSALQGVKLDEAVNILNRLAAQCRVQLLEDPKSKTVVFKLVEDSEAAKLKGLGVEDIMVFNAIKVSANRGIWTKDLKSRTNLPQPQISKSLRELEKRKLVKSVKSVSNANKKVYMLYELEPAKELSGGAWYTEQQLDAEFIQFVQTACYSYICKHADCSLDELTEYVRSTGIAKVELRAEDVSTIVDTLEYDGKIERLGGDVEDTFRKSVMELPDATAFTSIPCGVCPVFHECSPNGRISPATCVYYQKWLQF